MSTKAMRLRLLAKGKRVNEYQLRAQRDKEPRPEHVIPTWNICRGDTVEVLRGKDAGKQGVVRKVLRRQNRLVVRGVNLVKKPIPAQMARRQPGAIAGDLLTIEAPLHYSAVALVDPTTNQPTKVVVRKDDEGRRVRVARKSGAVIENAPFLVRRQARVPKADTVRDTPPDVVAAVSFSNDSLLPWPRGVPPPGWKSRIALIDELAPPPALQPRAHPSLRQLKELKDARKLAIAQADAAGLASEAAAAQVLADAAATTTTTTSASSEQR
jgi:large subunit ribosomal protein L24